MLLEKRTERSPFIRAAQHAFQFENEHDLDLTGFDVAYECPNAGPVHRAARVSRIGIARDLEPAFGGLFGDVVAAHGRLAVAGIEAPADLVGG